MKAYKLTRQDCRSANNTLWGENITHEIAETKKDANLCTDSWLHFYVDPLLAMLFNPIHANIEEPFLWEAKAEGKILHEPLKSGCKKLTTIKQIPIPEISITQRVAFAILCAKKVYGNPDFVAWADNWLNGKNRTKETTANAYASATANAYVCGYANAYVIATATAYAATYASATATAYACAYAATCLIPINKLELQEVQKILLTTAQEALTIN